MFLFCILHFEFFHISGSNVITEIEAKNHKWTRHTWLKISLLNILVHLFKTLVFPVVMYGCESWTIKKAECWKIVAFEPWCWRRHWESLGLQGDPVFILKEISSEYSLEGLMMEVKTQYFGHLMQRTDSFEKTLMLGKIEGGRRRGPQRMRWLNGITDSMDMFRSIQFNCCRVQLFATPWTAARQASLSITNSQSLPTPMSIESMMPSNHLLLCRSLLLLPSIFPSIRDFSNESLLRIRWPSTGVSSSASVLLVNI